MGLKADIIIWDLTTMTLLHRMSLHKVKDPGLESYLTLACPMTVCMACVVSAGESAGFGLFM